MTEERDLMFQLYYRDDNEDKVDVVPNEKVECHLMMEEGEITCSKFRTCEYQLDAIISSIHVLIIL